MAYITHATEYLAQASFEITPERVKRGIFLAPNAITSANAKLWERGMHR